MRLILLLSFMIAHIHARGLDKSTISSILPFQWWDKAITLSFKIITKPLEIHARGMSNNIKKRISKDLFENYNKRIDNYSIEQMS